MAAAEKSVAAIIPRRHVVTTDCMGGGRLMRTGCSREEPSRPHFSLLRESRSQNSQIRAVFVVFCLVSASFESAGLVAARASSRKGPVSGLRDGTFAGCGELRAAFVRCSSRGSPVSLVLDGTSSGCGGNRHDGDPVIARPPRWRGAVAKRLGWPNLLQDTEGPPKPMRILVSVGLHAIREYAPNVTRLRDHRMPCATMALATLTKPAALAPSIRSPSWPYSLAAARESATMVSMMFLSLASTSSKDHDRR